MDSQVSVYFSATANYSSSQAIVSVTDNKPDASTIEEAESSLQKNDSLNNEVTISVSNINGLNRTKTYPESHLYDVRRKEDRFHKIDGNAIAMYFHNHIVLCKVLFFCSI